MATFCTSCGTTVRDGATFCGHCGAAITGAAVPAAAPPRPAAAPSTPPAYSAPAPAYQPAPAAAAKGSNTLLKVVLGVFAVFVLFAMVAVAGLIYTGFWVKNAVEKKAAENGIDINAIMEGKKGEAYEPCSLLTTQEASEILGMVVERSETSGATCNYYVQAPTAEERQAALADAFKNVQDQANSNAGTAGEAGASPDAVRKSGIEQLTKAFGGAAVDANTPYFTVEVNPDGAALMAATKFALASSGVQGVSEDLQGIGDQAMMGPLDSLMVFMKNGTGIQIDLRLVGNGRDRGIAMAQRIVSRM